MKIEFYNHWDIPHFYYGNIEFLRIIWQFDEYYRGFDISILNFNILIYW